MRCNPLANRSEMTIPIQAWGEGLASNGYPINFWFYDNAAHGLLAGPLKREMRVYGTGSTAMTRYGWTGGNSDEANRFTKDLVEEIKTSYR